LDHEVTILHHREFHGSTAKRRKTVKSRNGKRSLAHTANQFTRISAVLISGIIILFNTVSAGEVSAPAAKVLEEMTIRSTWFPAGTVTLRNGEHRAPASPGSSRGTVVKLTDKRDFGMVNGREGGAVVIITDPGASGTFFDLALLIKGPEGWINVDTVLLGDRVKIHAVKIRDNEIAVSMTSHGPGDALCCPTQERTMRFSVRADRLVALGEEKITDGEQMIIGPVWQWVTTRYNNDAVLTRPAGAAGYTLQMKQDGTIAMRGDCNRGGGSFTVHGRKLTIAITHTTRAACPEGSQEDLFIRDLNRTSGYSVKNGTLYLDLQNDTGSMELCEVGNTAR
jgi:heat shock protein HslJ